MASRNMSLTFSGRMSSATGGSRKRSTRWLVVGSVQRRRHCRQIRWRWTPWMQICRLHSAQNSPPSALPG
jgi:hypothetical protein